MLRLLGTVLVAFALTTAGCGGSKVARKAADPAKPQPITVQTPDIRVTLAGVLKEGDEGTLVKDKGWWDGVLGSMSVVVGAEIAGTQVPWTATKLIAERCPERG
jgi:hypothetical protein